MGRFLKKIAHGIKNAVEAVGDVADKVTDGLGEAAGWVTDKVGDVTEGVTRVVAGDKAADKVGKAFDERLEPAIKRSIKGLASIAFPVGALDDIAEKGFIDGVVQHATEGTQDILGGTTRLVAGEKAENKFDKVFDNKIQKWVELAAGTAARVGLLFVPGGQLALLADVGSELASIGYRAGNGEKIGVFDYLDAAESLFTLAGAGLGQGASVASKAGTTAAQTGAKSLSTPALQATTASQVTRRIGTEVGLNVSIGVGASKIIEHRQEKKAEKR